MWQNKKKRLKMIKNISLNLYNFSPVTYCCKCSIARTRKGERILFNFNPTMQS